MNEQPGLIISLDFELNWGYTNQKIPLNNYAVDDTLSNIKNLFDKYNIRSTWATVGQLFLNKESSEGKEDDNLYRHLHWIKKNLEPDNKVEIASHSFNHTFFMECDLDEQIQDFEMSKMVGYDFKTLVFPRNQFNDRILELASNYGIDLYRDVQKKWFLQSSKFTNEPLSKLLIKRLFELIPSNRSVEFSEYKNILGISDSRFFRFFPNGILGNFISKYYNALVCSELEYCLRQGKLYHIWFHPHNLITRPNRITELESFLQFFDKKKSKYEAKSYNMQDVISQNK